MFFLFSGEGATDLGLCAHQGLACNHDTYEYGPMAVFVDQIVEKDYSYSILEATCCGFVSKQRLKEKAKELKPPKRPPLFAGKKRPLETGYFFLNARAMAICAREKEAQINSEVVAVLFRDSDGTASAGRGLWPDKRKSMLDGFAEEGFLRGVPMIPKPKSEAWIICALKADPYVGCDPLEDRSGNDRSPNSLKGELERLLGEPATRELLLSKIEDGSIDCHRITMPSFLSFRASLKKSCDERTPRKPL